MSTTQRKSPHIADAEPSHLNIRQVMLALEVSRDKVLMLVAAGTLKAIQTPDGRIVIERATVLAYKDAR
jgi:hypothetical protein